MIELLFVCAVGTKLPSAPPPPPEPIRIVGICGKQISLKDEEDEADDDNCFYFTSRAVSLFLPSEKSKKRNKNFSIVKTLKQKLNRRGNRNH